MQSLETTVSASVADAEAAIRTGLAANGFGVLTEIDVAATFKAKLGLDRPALKILGACNPTLAHRAIELDGSVTLLLPCNVVVEDVGGGSTRIAIADPRQLMDDPAFASLADEAAAKLGGALDAAAAALA